MHVRSALSFAALIVNLALGFFVTFRYPKPRLNRIYAAIAFSFALWALGEYLVSSTTSWSVALAGARFTHIAACLTGGLYLIGVLAFLNRKDLLSNRWFYVSVFAPGMIILALFLNGALIESAGPAQKGFNELTSPLRVTSQMYVLILILIALGALIEALKITPSIQEKMGIRILIFTSLLAVAMGVVTSGMIPWIEVDPVQYPVFLSLVITPVYGVAAINKGIISTVADKLGGSLLNAIREAVFVTDSSWIVENANSTAAGLVRLPEQDMIGKPLQEVLSFKGKQTEDVMLSSSILTIRIGDDEIPVSVNVEPVKKFRGAAAGYFVFIHDLRETFRLIEAENQAKVAVERATMGAASLDDMARSSEDLMEMSEFLESIMQSLNEPIWIKNRDLRYVYVNRAFCEAYNVRKDAAIGKMGEEIWSNDKVMISTEYDRKALEEGITVESIETPFHLGPDNPAVLETFRTPMFGEDGNVEYVIGISTDITEQKRLATARLDFVRIAAHELRTPLTSLKLGFELLAKETKGQLTETQQRSVDILSLSIDKLATLSKNLLDLASLDAGVLSMHKRSTSIRRLLDEAATLFAAEMDSKSLEYTVETPEDLPLVYADPVRIGQLLNSLISNAIKNTDSGSIKLAADELDTSMVRVTVEDTGVGIPESLSKNLFQNLFSDELSGFGISKIGLNISKAIVEAHEGAIWVDSEPGVGSKFQFTLPIVGSKVVGQGKRNRTI